MAHLTRSKRVSNFCILVFFWCLKLNYPSISHCLILSRSRCYIPDFFKKSGIWVFPHLNPHHGDSTTLAAAAKEVPHHAHRSEKLTQNQTNPDQPDLK
ncbi:MAG: hypothetical protein U7126_08670 [Microcoleus sp.]